MSMQCACRTVCFPAPAPVQMLFRLGFAKKMLILYSQKFHRTKVPKFIKIGKWATFLTLNSGPHVTDHGPPGRSRNPKPHIFWRAISEEFLVLRGTLGMAPSPGWPHPKENPATAPEIPWYAMTFSYRDQLSQHGYVNERLTE